jgi:hypothetical protein
MCQEKVSAMADEHIVGIVILARSNRSRPFIHSLRCLQTHRNVTHFKVVYSHLPIHSRVVIYHDSWYFNFILLYYIFSLLASLHIL